jgi:NAD(P)-dependent dehydrogenase (short-subunit alcohol dehydrogenase family)
MTTPSLRDQRIVIIGGSSGIGFAVAECAVAEGARVVIGSSGADRVEAAVSRLGQAASGRTLNVKEEPTVSAFFQEIGEFDHLVYTAGDWDRALTSGPLSELDIAAATDHGKVRFWGALTAVKHAQSYLRRGGSITLTDGVLAHRPQKGGALTTAFAGGLEHLARGLAVDLAPIRVNAVCPGLVLTEAVAAWPAEMLSRWTRGQPIPRGGDPGEVAQAYLYLMRAGYTTGQVIIVDGGRMLV